ncbi:M1 family metallopeptidase [Salibacteraceae bacterium]|nr:M1 family metallopeptidase [Salibacteraceae bacterium]
MKKLLLLLIGIVGGIAVQAQDTLCYLDDINRFPRERFVDFQDMNLMISFQSDSGKVMGSVVHRFNVLRSNVDSLYLDGTNMTIASAKLDGKSVRYEVSKKGIIFRFDSVLALNSVHRLSIDYSAKPRRGMYFIGWDDPTGRCRKQIWTQGQGIDNRNWVPLFDDMSDKITTMIGITFDSKYKVLSNGSLLTTSPDGKGNTTWLYQMNKPHSPYLMMIGIGDYAISKERSTSGILLNQYYYPDQKQTLEPTYRYSKKIFDFLETEIGIPYPWLRYSQIPVQDFPYGAMENTSATVFGDFFCVDEKSFNDANYVYVNGHELAHQWFGDLVTSRSPKHHWLHESFATYYHCLTSGQVFGDDEFRKMMYENQVAALTAGQNDYRGVGHSQANSSRHYLKGSYVLKMLRYVVGDKEFRMGLQKYLKDHQYENANTQDLIDAFHDTTGQEIAWFIDQWVSKGGEPHLKVEFSSNKKESNYTFLVEQLQDTTPLVATFKMPVRVEIYFESGKKVRKQFWLENQKDTFQLEMQGKEKISYVLFDPNQEILKQMYFTRPTDWLINQAMEADNMIDRFEALLALRSTSIKKKEQALRKVFSKEQYYYTQAEALKQLIDAGVNVKKEVNWMVEKGSPQLQKAVLSNWANIPAEYESAITALLSAKSYDVIQIALIRGVMNFKENTDYYLEQTKNVVGTKGKNVRIQWLEINAGKTKAEESYKELVYYTSNSFDFITRQNAIGALKRLNYCNEQLITNLCLGVQKANWKLSKSCGLLIRHFYNSDYKELVISAVKSFETTAEQKTRIERFLEETEK